jgi:hypothetical protein
VTDWPFAVCIDPKRGTSNFGRSDLFSRVLLLRAHDPQMRSSGDQRVRPLHCAFCEERLATRSQIADPKPDGRNLMICVCKLNPQRFRKKARSRESVMFADPKIRSYLDSSGAAPALLAETKELHRPVAIAKLSNATSPWREPSPEIKCSHCIMHFFPINMIRN